MKHSTLHTLGSVADGIRPFLEEAASEFGLIKIDHDLNEARSLTDESTTEQNLAYESVVTGFTRPTDHQANSLILKTQENK